MKAGFQQVKAFYSNEFSIPSEVEWNCNGHDMYVCAEGTKELTTAAFINNWWDRPDEITGE
jgi:hypothetical protein